MSMSLCSHSGQLRDSSNMVPVRDVHIARLVEVASMRSAEDSRRNTFRTQPVVRPLALLRIVAQKGHRHIVLVNDRDPPLQLRHNRMIAMKTHLARAPQMLRDVANELSIEVEMTQAKILAIAYQQQRLIVTCIHRQPMTAIAFPILSPLPGETRLIIPVLIEPEDTRVAIPIRDIERPIRTSNNRSNSPLIRQLESSLRRSSNLLHHRAIGLYLDHQPILRRRPLLHRGIEELISILNAVMQRMHLRILISNCPDQLARPVIDQHASLALRAHIEVARLVAGDRAMRSAKTLPRRQLSPVRRNLVCPLPISRPILQPTRMLFRTLRAANSAASKRNQCRHRSSTAKGATVHLV